MKPLRVALFHRDNLACLHRLVGAFSYPVPEFDWVHFVVPKHFDLDKVSLKAQGFDLIVHEDAGAYARVVSQANIPHLYVVRDSTLSPEHYSDRFNQAAVADLVLVDWDVVQRFADTGQRAVRWAHCVNDLFFRDYGLERTVDVGFYANIRGNPDREWLDGWLRQFCQGHGYSYASGRREWLDYARAFASCKLAVNLNRTPTTRNHRVLDAMAAGAGLLTSTLPEVSGEDFTGVCAQWADVDQLAEIIPGLLDHDNWYFLGKRGQAAVLQGHTWAVRAGQLRQIVQEVFPWVG